MSTIVTRSGKGSALTHAEVDANFTNLNTDKAERGAANTFSATNTFSGNISSSGTNTFSGSNTFSSSVTLSGTCTFTGANTFTNSTGQIFRRAAGQDGVLLRGRAGGASSYTAEIVPATLTASRTFTLPDSSGTLITTGDSGVVTSTMIANATIVDADISATAEIAVSKLADGAARQLLQTDAAGTGVEWTNDVDIPGTLDVAGDARFDSSVQIGQAAGPGYGIAYILGPNISNSLQAYGDGLKIAVDNTAGTNRLRIESDSIEFVTTGGFVAFQAYSNFLARAFGTVTAKNTTATLLAFEMYSGIVTSTTASAVSLTLPTATTMDSDMSTAIGGGTYVFNSCFEWSVINTGSTNSVTLLASTGHTIVGSAVVTAGNSGRFLTVKDGNPSYKTYRISS